MKERLHKILARHGVASRREAERLMAAGRVAVNGVTVTVPGSHAEPARDKITLDGVLLPPLQSSRVLMLHKPPGFLCTRRKSREKGHTIFDILPSDRRYFSIGRLDKDSSGLLLVTDDGELAFRLTHPRHGTRKTYLVDTDVSLSASRVRRLTKGIELEDGIARALEARAVSQHRLCIVLAEGRKRQIRRMTAALGARVTRLHRIQVGNLELGELIPGEWRELSPQEIERLTMSPSRVPAK